MATRSDIGDTSNVVKSIILLSTVISIFLVWFIYFKIPASAGEGVKLIGYLPAVNATLNAMCSLFLVFGFFAIRSGNKLLHKRLMITALVFSVLFLISYLTYHHYQGDTRFLATGVIRPIYFFILITHIICSIGVLPMVLITVYHALQGRFSNHRRIARLTFPVWLYVSVTGVLVFVLLHFFNAQI